MCRRLASMADTYPERCADRHPLQCRRPCYGRDRDRAGAIYLARERGIASTSSPTRRGPCQGSRLTAWELDAGRIPVTVLIDGGGVFDVVRTRRSLIVGADRIAQWRRREQIGT